ncbi:hypothetical protein MKX54_13390 [Alkalihalobacillus sp. FSL R5-0424]
MKAITLVFKLCIVIVTFFLYLLGLMNVFPVLIGGVLFFLSILFLLYPSVKANRFKGFRS